jgi:hypothetical protein
MRLQRAKNLMEFFREKVHWVRRRQNIQLTEMTEFYVVNLLSEAIDSRKMISDEPLALMVGRALSAPNETERFRIFKQVGDRSLYISGFFGESLARRAIDLDYFISMGELAYRFVSSMAEERRRSSPELFAELSEKFAPLVDLLSEISESTGITSDTEILRLYERWLQTKSDRLLHLLSEKGIIPVDPKKEPLQ